jgi:hypothetical protein
MSDRKMSKIVISYDDGTTKITHEHDGGGHWNEHVQAMINFLRGIGYSIPDEEDRV